MEKFSVKKPFTVLVGVIKLLFAFGSNGAGLPILGDLLPALLGIAGGASILIMYYEDKSEITIPEAVSSLFTPYNSYEVLSFSYQFLFYYNKN